MPESDAYLGSHRFTVTLGSVQAADGFTSVSAIASFSEVILFKHGQDGHVRKVPGRVQWEDITFERVYCGDDIFAQWRESIIKGASDRRDITVEYQDNAGTMKKSFQLIGCFPVRWELPALDAQGSSGAMERITVACEDVIGT